MFKTLEKEVSTATWGDGGGVEARRNGNPVTVSVPEEGAVEQPCDLVMVRDLNGRYTCFFSGTGRDDVRQIPGGMACDITHLGHLNQIWPLNDFLAEVNARLPEGGYFTGCAVTNDIEMRRLREAYPAWIAWPLYVARFLVHRVLPKLSLTQGLYFRVMRRRSRALTKAEILGRLVYGGFEIVEQREIGDEFYFIGRKAGAPCHDRGHSWGPLFRMRRIGQHGEAIHVYKLRTMHPYAEYLQAYVYAQNNLQENGKFKDDFRITSWGRLMRKLWIDELPMLINWLRGDLKLVGVRPLSEHYLSLYPADLIDRRLRHKPGLIPPFYADNPEGFEEIVASEARYLHAYEQHPFKTDLQYLGKIFFNIVIKGARSR